MRNETLIKKINNAISEYSARSPGFRDFWRFLFAIGDFYIVGGAIRAIYNNRKPRDIDIIVKKRIDKLISKLSESVPISKNYFGGYKIDFNGIIVDLWDFDNHWAFKTGILGADECNLAKSCFFNFDALVYSPITNYLDIDLFKHSLKSHTIDFISHDSSYVKNNPGELTNVLRVLIAAKDFNLSFSDAVATYIKSYLDGTDFSSLKLCEFRHYREEKISCEQVKGMLRMIDIAISNNIKRAHISRSYARTARA